MAKFGIIDATKKGFIQTWRDREDLVKRSFLVYLVHVVAFYFLAKNINLFQHEETQQLQIEFIKGMPLYSAFALLFLGVVLLSYVFIHQVRWILLQEKELPKNEKKRKPVIRTYIYAITVFILVLVFKEAINQGALAIGEMLKGLHYAYMIAFGALNIIVSLWLVRLSVLHVPLGIDYPIKDFLQKIKGFKISFYLLGLLITCIVPISFFSLMAMAIVVEVSNLIQNELIHFTIPVFASFFYIVGFLVLNNASIFALDEVMKAKDEGE